MTRHYIAALVILIFGVGRDVSGQPADLPTPEALFEAAGAVIGWQTGPAGVGRIEAHAHVTVDDISYQTMANAHLVDGYLGNSEFTMIRQDGTTVYSETSGLIRRQTDGGPLVDMPATFASFVRGHHFHYRALFPRFELASVSRDVSDAEFAGERAFKVSGRTRADNLLDYYFDQREKRMLGYRLTIEEPEGPHVIDFMLKDWRTSGGQQLFRRLEIDDRGRLFTYRFSKILVLP